MSELTTQTKEMKSAQADFASTFQAFKSANDERLEALEQKQGDGLLIDKVDRINAALDAQSKRIENLSISAARPAIGGEAVNVEAKSAWSSYIRTGDGSELASLEGKSLSSSVDAEGGYVAPAETESRIDRALIEASPFRRISTVRRVGAGFFKKPVSAGGASSGWAGETEARIGALLSNLPSGPVGRWDMANIIDVFLPNTALSSLSAEAIYDGGNRFALETATGWEIFQAANAELTAPSTYSLSRLLRGQNGSDADMQDVIPSGARIVWLGAGWQDLPVSAGLIGETVPLSAMAAGRESDTLHHLYEAAHLRPLSPVHPKITQENGQTTISWTRRTRIGGDSWAGLDVPLGEEEERYRLQFWVEGAVIAEYETIEPTIVLNSLESADSLSIAQASRAFGWGAAETLLL